jgi:hypothetical protein
MVALIVRMPPDAIARLRAVAVVRRLAPGRVLAVALRLYERRGQGRLGNEHPCLRVADISVR